MNEFFASKNACIKLKQAVAEETRSSGQLHAVRIIFPFAGAADEDFIATEITLLQDEGMSFCDPSEPGQATVHIRGKGQKFYGKPIPHPTSVKFIGL